MNSKFLKKKLKVKKLKKIFDSQIIFLTQSNLLKSNIENLFLKEILSNNFESLRVSSNILKNFLKIKFTQIEPISSNNCRIFYTTKNLTKEKIYHFINFLNSKNINFFLSFYFFSNFLNLKSSVFLFRYLFNLGIKFFLYKFFYRSINLLIINFNTRVNNGI